jgi:hypothetical protein
VIKYVPFAASGGFGTVITGPSAISSTFYRIATDGNYLYVLNSISTSSITVSAYSLTDLTQVGSTSENLSRSRLGYAMHCGSDGYIYIGNGYYTDVLTFNGSVFARVGGANLNSVGDVFAVATNSGYSYVAHNVGTNEVFKCTFDGSNLSGTGYNISSGSSIALQVDADFLYVLDVVGNLIVCDKDTMTAITSVDTSAGSAASLAIDGTYIYVYTSTGVFVYSFNGSTLTPISSSITRTDSGYQKCIFADDHLIVADSDDLYALRMDLTAQFTVNSQSGQVGDTFTFTAI